MNGERPRHPHGKDGAFRVFRAGLSQQQVDPALTSAMVMGLPSTSTSRSPLPCARKENRPRWRDSGRDGAHARMRAISSPPWSSWHEDDLAWAKAATQVGAAFLGVKNA
jgi:hypothetical protein